MFTSEYTYVSMCWYDIALINRPIEFIGPETLIIRRNESKWRLGGGGGEQQNRRNQHPLIQLDRNPISKDDSLSTNSIHTNTHTHTHTHVTPIIYLTNHKFRLNLLVLKLAETWETEINARQFSLPSVEFEDAVKIRFVVNISLIISCWKWANSSANMKTCSDLV